MAQTMNTASRARAILRTQFPPRWGPQYIPAQLFTRAQAPSASKPSEDYSAMLQRHMHFMSRGERALTALALRHPALFEFKEQFALSPKPSPHPMVGHQLAEGLSLPSTTGTVPIAERLGLLSLHPKVMEKLDDGTVQWIPNPLRRDLLLFLKDKVGPYCVTWDVKRDAGAHGQPGPGDWIEKNNPKKIQKAEALDAIFVEYMRELGIPVVRVALSDLNKTLVSNLCRLLAVHAQPIHLAPQLHVEAVEAFAEALKLGTPPNEVIDRFVQAKVDGGQVKLVLEQAIWQRRIQIDLYSWWSIDQPLLPEVKDPLVENAAWFAR